MAACDRPDNTTGSGYRPSGRRRFRLLALRVSREAKLGAKWSERDP